MKAEPIASPGDTPHPVSVRLCLTCVFIAEVLPPRRILTIIQRGAFVNLRNNLDIYNYKQLDLKEGARPVPSELRALEPPVRDPVETLKRREIEVAEGEGVEADAHGSPQPPT